MRKGITCSIFGQALSSPALFVLALFVVNVWGGFSAGDAFAQQGAARVPISGTVLSGDNNEPLPGVNIIVKGTTIGTSSDADGRFELNVPSLQDTLVLSFIGYTTQEVALAGRTELSVTLAPEVLTGEEVVVVGYGSISEEDLTGSTSRIRGEELLSRPALSVEQALAGKAPGVQITTNSGRPGGRTNVRIRGSGSINASNAPLYVVDGVVLTAGISSIDPNDIESIEVLKDASSTAIYGTRGSNGVIMITTKRGRRNSSNLTYHGYTTAGRMARKQEVLSSEEFLYIEEQAYANAQKYDPVGWANGRYRDPKEIRREYMVGNTLGNPELFDENLNPLYDVDWQDAVTRTAISQSHNLAYTGGADNTTYGLFLGYTEENGIIKDSYMRRANVRAVIDSDVKDWLRVGGTVSYANNQEKRADEAVGGNNVPRMIIEMIPIVPYKYPDGTYGRREDYPNMETGDNPQAQLEQDSRNYNINTFNGNAYATITPLEGMEFTSRFGVNQRNQYNPYFNGRYSNFGGGLGRNYAEIWSYDARSWQWSNHLNYSFDLNNVHEFYTTVGAELQGYDYLQWYVGTYDIADDYYKWNNLGAGSTPNAPSSSTTAWRMASFFARVNYNFDNRYLLTLTGRQDGSSRFGADKKYAFFPSAAFAWRVSEEDFLRDNRTISDLKLRVSYGLTGNSEIGEYRSLANLGTNTAIFNGNRASGTVISSLANPNLEWEKSEQLDLGFDLGLFNDRIELTADYFIRNTRDLLLNAPVPRTSGYSSMTRNIGSIQNQGIELALNTVNIQSNDFLWMTSFNLTHNKNKVTALGVNNEDIFPGPWFLNQTNVLRVGEPVGSFWGLIREGTWGTDEAEEAARYGKLPGDLKFRDLNNDGQINENDYTIIGNGTPDFYGSLINTVNYKNFDFTLELQYMLGHDVYMLTEHSSLDRTGIANSYRDVLNAWTPENQNTMLAQWRPTSAGYDSFLDSYKVKDGSFLRGKNIALGYTLPTHMANRLGVGNVRLYVAAQNFFLLTKYEGYDPETTTYGDAFAQGIQFHDYPKARTFQMGVNLTF